MIPEGPYEALARRKDQLLHNGFNYKGQILRRTLSSQMYDTDALLPEYLDRMDGVIFETVESVKSIKAFANIALDKNERRIV